MEKSLFQTLFTTTIRWVFLILLVGISSHLAYSQEDISVFKSGEEGYKSYRIPAIIGLHSGKILAFCEGRVHHAGDFGHIRIVYKSSDDGGKTWSPIAIAADFDTLQVGNPAPVVDYQDPAFPNGRIFLFYNTGNNHESEVRKGNGYREVWYITSTDEGQTWSKPVNITTQVHRPNQPDVRPEYNYKEDWRAYANTPGHAMQFDSGPYIGRLYISANRSEGNPKPNGKDYFAFGYYSDDHGKTFQISDKIPYEGSNESMAAQVSSTELYMNSRNQQGHILSRIVARSKDGGQTWANIQYDANLPDPVNQGSVLSWAEGKQYLLAVCNAASTSSRDKLTLRISKNKGKSWYLQYPIARAPKGFKGDYAAYSDMVLVDRNTIGILYEKENYSKIVFTKVAIK